VTAEWPAGPFRSYLRRFFLRGPGQLERLWDRDSQSASPGTEHHERHAGAAAKHLVPNETHGVVRDSSENAVVARPSQRGRDRNSEADRLQRKSPGDPSRAMLDRRKLALATSHGNALDHRAGRMKSVDLQVLVTEDEVIPRAKLASTHAYTVDHGAIGRREILKHPAPVAKKQASMAARDAWVREDDIAAWITPEDQLALGTAPVERQQNRLGA
jgi:hypothetical protein